ncbi:MAG TPA: YicC/YloC family endoribonuclease, partial [Myxococcales bacterium]|nr:YicC/YloC family endoribonuclease [Myxococcales bacterium]
MIRSMTGFGAGRAQAGSESVAAELRSVNGKFCDVRTHLPRDLAGLEQVVARIVKARLARGVVDVTVRRESEGTVRGAIPAVDLPLAAAYAKAFRELQAELGLAGEVTVHDLIGLDGVVTLAERAPDLGPLAEAVERALSAALDALEEMRRREGEALARDLAARLTALENGAAAIRAAASESVQAYR